jgi:hypothetical protein
MSLPLAMSVTPLIREISRTWVITHGDARCCSFCLSIPNPCERWELASTFDQPAHRNNRNSSCGLAQQLFRARDRALRYDRAWLGRNRQPIEDRFDIFAVDNDHAIIANLVGSPFASTH